MKIAVFTNICFLFPCLIWVMVVLLLGGQEIDSNMRAGWMVEEIFAPPSFLLDFNSYPLSHICYPCLLQIVTELCICQRSSRGEEWYNTNLPPRITKQRAWALNEGCCVDKYMCIFSLSHMGYGGVVAGGTSY